MGAGCLLQGGNPYLSTKTHQSLALIWKRSPTMEQVALVQSPCRAAQACCLHSTSAQTYELCRGTAPREPSRWPSHTRAGPFPGPVRFRGGQVWSDRGTAIAARTQEPD